MEGAFPKGEISLNQVLTWPTYRLWLDRPALAVSKAQRSGLPSRFWTTESHLERDFPGLVPESVQTFTKEEWREGFLAMRGEYRIGAKLEHPCGERHAKTPPCFRYWLCPYCWCLLVLRLQFSVSRRLLFGPPIAQTKKGVPIFPKIAITGNVLWSMQRFEGQFSVGQIGDLCQLRNDRITMFSSSKKRPQGWRKNGLEGALGYFVLVCPRRTFADWCLQTTILAVYPSGVTPLDSPYLSGYYRRGYTGRMTQQRLARVLGAALAYPWASSLAKPANWRWFLKSFAGSHGIGRRGAFRRTREEAEEAATHLFMLPVRKRPWWQGRRSKNF